MICVCGGHFITGLLNTVCVHEIRELLRKCRNPKTFRKVKKTGEGGGGDGKPIEIENNNGGASSSTSLLAHVCKSAVYLTIKHDGKCSCRYSSNSGDAPAQLVSSSSSRCRIWMRLDRPLEVSR